jgi:hypothetical protein
MKRKVRVLDRLHLEVPILVSQSDADVVTEEHPSDWNGTASIGNSNFGTQRKILHGGLNQHFRPGRAIDVDRLRPVFIPSDGHQRPKSRCVIVMVVGDENDADVSNIDSGLRHAANDAISGVNDVRDSIDD